MDALQVTARLSIHPGKLAEFKKLASECIEIVREKDSGTLQYDWFFNADETECVVRETYRDSAAVLEHVTNLGDNLGALLAVSDLALEVYGSPSAELVAATTGLAPKLYSAFQSI